MNHVKKGTYPTIPTATKKPATRELHPAVAAKLGNVPRISAAPTPPTATAHKVEADRAPAPLTTHEGTQQTVFGLRVPNEPTEADARDDVRDAKLPPARLVEKKLRYALKCIIAIGGRTHGWHSGAEGSLGAARVNLTEVIKVVAALPDDFKPPVGFSRRPSAAIEEGDTVDITEKARATYADVLEPAELAGLTVVRLSGVKVIARTATGTKVVLPRGHVAARKA